MRAGHSDLNFESENNKTEEKNLCICKVCFKARRFHGFLFIISMIWL